MDRVRVHQAGRASHVGREFAAIIYTAKDAPRYANATKTIRNFVIRGLASVRVNLAGLERHARERAHSTLTAKIVKIVAIVRTTLNARR